MKKLFAINGGEPIIKNHARLVSRWPKINKQDISDVTSVLKNGDFSGRNSKIVKKLEVSLSKFLGRDYCSLFNSGTSALHGCINALGIGVGDEVIVPSYTFLSPAMAVLHAGAVPVFCDIDNLTFNIDPFKIEQLITPNTKAVIAVSMHGLPADLIKIKQICKKHNLKLIEDCAQSFGAKIGKNFCGSFGDISAFSFMSAKQLATCGELGAVITDNKKFLNKANSLKIYGELLGENGQRYYNSFSLGYNYVANTIQAKVCASKLKSFYKDIEGIIFNAEFLSRYIKENIPFLEPPFVPNGYKHVYHFFRVKVNGEKIGYKNNGILRQAIMNIMEKEGLKLRLYQNSPVCGQYIFQSLNKFGNGFPFSVNNRNDQFYKKNYNIYNFPETLAMIEGSFIVGALGAAPLYFQNRPSVSAYIKGFKKINENLDELIEYANSLEEGYKRPWDDVVKISDTNGVFKNFI